MRRSASNAACEREPDSGCSTGGSGRWRRNRVGLLGRFPLTLEPADFGRKRRLVAFELRNAALRVSDGFGGGRGRWRRGRGTGDGRRPSGDGPGGGASSRGSCAGASGFRDATTVPPSGEIEAAEGAGGDAVFSVRAQQGRRKGRDVRGHHQHGRPHQARDKHPQRRQSGDEDRTPPATGRLVGGCRRRKNCFEGGRVGGGD